MGTQALRSGEYFTYSAAEALRRIEDWFHRGYVMFSDVKTKSTHLRRVGPNDAARRDQGDDSGSG